MAADRDFQILLMGTPEINRFVSSNPEARLELRERRIIDKDLSGALLSSADLHKAEFRNCKLVAINFSEAALAEAQFIGCDLSKANFVGADLAHTRIENCILDECNF
jgi:uncharacterized protein YjbI with pentapeptide repeats